ncbi:MAG: serine/threonine-protein kinase [Acidobacteria bacterium]|nr:serine/threonine-protein kinase [Acidobacteriota bacterium]
MPLAAGTKLGPYEIQAPLGTGGMGEVYKATDTRLDRVVALKVLPQRLAAHEDVRERFEREARAASSLNHPHICALYDIGHDNGLDYLVLEYLEGETLAVRLTRGPLPVGQALEYAIQIADALDKAHRAGIVHRDLKPGNVMLTSRGAHLLDFGIAKWQPAAPDASGLTSAPTTAGNLTDRGTVLGTFQYMAPEQLEGRKTDGRTDIFALGTLVYEMVTGRKAFHGETQASLVTAILTLDPPPMRSLRPSVPDVLDRVVAICLAKNPDDRWQSAHDLLLQLQWVAARSGPIPAAPLSRRWPPSSRRALWVLAAAITSAVAIFGLSRVMSAAWGPSSRGATARFLVGPEPGSTMTTVSDPEISPDGRRLAFVASSAAGTRMLAIRSLASIEALLLDDTEGAANPFWSPDGQWIAFFAGGKLHKASLGGGKPQAICSASEGSGTWGRDGDLLFTTGSASGVIHRVPSAGGEPKPVTHLDASRHEVVHLWPHFLPDGDHFLFLALGFSAAAGDPDDGIYVASLRTGERKLISPVASRPAYAPEGYLLFARNGRLQAQRFDAAALKVTGEPIDVADDLLTYRATGRAAFSVSRTGVLAVQPGAPTTRLAWIDRDGTERSAIGVPADYGRFRLSPDGTRVVVEIADQQTGTSDLWITQLDTGATQQMTRERSDETNAAWARDGRAMAFSSDRDGPPDIFVIDLPPEGGSHEEARLKSGTTSQQGRPGSTEKARNGEDMPAPRPLLQKPKLVLNPNDWSPDGKWLLFEEFVPRHGWNIILLPLDGGPSRLRPLLTGPANEYGGRFSPDGRALAYVSDETGRPEVYVRGLEDEARATRISETGGSRPRWNPRGGELFFLSDRGLISVKVSRGSDGGFAVSEPVRLFEAGPADVTHYEVAPDGARFLVNAPPGDARATPFVVTLNWPADLGQPRGK